MFWADTHAGQINKAGLDGTRRQKLLSSVKGITGLAVDWIANAVLWSIAEKGTIQRMDTDGRNEKTVLRDLSQPRSVVVDPNERSQSLRMAIFLDYVYLTDSKSKRITRVNKYTGGRGENVNSRRMPHPPADVKAVHPINQPVVEIPNPFTPGCNRQTGECVKVCSSHSDTGLCRCRDGFSLSKHGNYCEDINECALWNHGCSLGCENIPGSYFCTCPEGYLLLPDLKTCQAGPPAYLLFANMVDIRQINADGKKSKTLLEEPRGSIIAVDYDPVQEQVYFADKGLKRIERASLNGGFREMLFSTGLDSPEGLAVDWVHRKLYWTDRGFSTISRSDLNGLGREIFIDKDIQKPRGIALHPQAQKVYWTDVGSRPVVERSGLNRDLREVVVSTSLVSPTGLAVDHGSQRLYWCDLSRGVIESANLDGSDRHMLSENQVGRPFDVAVFENVLWVSDWEGHVLYRLDMRTGRNSEHLHDISIQPAALVVVHPLAKPGADVCLHENGGCAQVCESRLGLAHCSCHSKHVLSADGKYCLAINTSYTESDDGESTDRLRNKTLNDESTPLAMLYTERMVSDVDECKTGLADCSISEAECVNTAGGYFCQCKTGFSGDGHHCMDIDECRLVMHSCDENAECLNAVGKYQCRCRPGFTGTGFSCHEDFKGASSWPSTGSPLDVTSPWQHNNAVQSCPSTHDSYCLYDGVCFYFPEMESYACKQVCVLGYMGERCQFSDLEWWELQQAEEEKRRNMAIAVCIVLFISLLSIAACITYCYGSKRRFGTCPSEDDVGDISMSEDSFTETTAAPQVYVVLDPSPCIDEKVLHVVGCPRTTICPSCSSNTRDSFALEEAGKLQRDNRGQDVASCSVSCDVHTLLVTEKTTDNLITLEDPQASPQ
ncbi:pro-epidermal growth factor-like protein [Labeo rohita]|uniref:Pro-epidermal growth factor-like protein n=1 Tax=Labeo rohita TaxID=84645 RepID=A0A498MRY5_LABRO|nr:pro-epidermal growth factor-like protein [Labeo rohita]